jgi:DNA polymerase-3 subunit epsilon
MEFAAIDFELANERYDSARSCGVVVVRNGQIRETRHWLIRPPDIRFGDYQISVLKVDRSVYRNQPQLCDVWGEIYALLADRVVLAHNAGFDMGVLAQSLGRYGIAPPALDYACTCSIAKGTWEGLDDYQLPTIARTLGLSFEHHLALEDARVCAEIALASIRHFGVVSFDAWELQTGAYRQRLSRQLVVPEPDRQPTGPRFIKPDVPLEDLRPSQPGVEVDPTNPFYRQVVVFTGTLVTFANETAAAQEVVDRGGRCKNHVCKKKTTLLVLGQFDPPKTSSGNLDNAKKWRIRVIDEHTFNRLLNREA